MTRITDLTEKTTLTGAEFAELSSLSTTVTITATTISALASDNSYNDSGSGFVAAGFAIGDRVNVTGFTGDAANNIFAATVTAVTAGKLTIGGTDGDVIVDDAAGESVTITKWESRRATAQAVSSAPPDLSDVTFVATISAGVNNVTGAGAGYQVVWNTVGTACASVSLNTGTGAMTLAAGLYFVQFSTVFTGTTGATRSIGYITQDGSIVDYRGTGGDTVGLAFTRAAAVVRSTGSSVIATVVEIHGQGSNASDLNNTSTQTRVRISKLA